MWLNGSGIITYDPPRPGMKRKTKWWSIVKTDREITRYYRWWLQKEKWISLHQPAWDAHISIIRGEEPKPHLKHLWKKYDGQRVNFKYSPIIQQVDVPGREHFWYITVQCQFLKDIRREMELPYTWDLHLTIGRTYY